VRSDFDGDQLFVCNEHEVNSPYISGTHSRSQIKQYSSYSHEEGAGYKTTNVTSHRETTA
jgi:hypothetical protein